MAADFCGSSRTSLVAQKGFQGFKDFSPLDARRRVIIASEERAVDISPAEIITGGRADIYDAIAEQNILRISMRGGVISFQACGYVGLIPINDRIAIDIRPKVPIANLDRVLVVSGEALVPIFGFLRYYEAGPNTTLIDLLTDCLLDALNEIAVRGRSSEFKLMHEVGQFPKGKIGIAASIRALAARAPAQHVSYSWYSREINVGINRLLKYAVWQSAQRYLRTTGYPGAHLRLQRLNFFYRMFSDISLDHSKRFLAAPQVADPSKLPSIRSYYLPAVHVAKLLVSNTGFGLSGDSRQILLSSFIVNMASVFERYSRNVLRMQFEATADYKVLDGNLGGATGARRRLFSEAAPEVNPMATPDIVIARDGKAELVLEVKYKVRDSAPDRDDINQIVSYCNVYDVRRGVLLLPASDERNAGISRLGLVGNIELFSYRYPMQSPSLEIIEAKLFADIRALLA